MQETKDTNNRLTEVWKLCAPFIHVALTDNGVRDYDDLQDCKQMALIRLWHNLDKIRENTIRSFAYLIGRSIAVDFHRRTWRTAKHVNPIRVLEEGGPHDNSYEQLDQAIDSGGYLDKLKQTTLSTNDKLVLHALSLEHINGPRPLGRVTGLSPCIANNTRKKLAVKLKAIIKQSELAVAQ